MGKFCIILLKNEGEIIYLSHVLAMFIPLLLHNISHLLTYIMIIFILGGGGGGGGGVTCPPMSAYVLSFLDSMRQRTCFLGH